MAEELQVHPIVSDDVTDVTSFYAVMEQPKVNGLDELNNNLPDKGS